MTDSCLIYSLMQGSPNNTGDGGNYIQLMRFKDKNGFGLPYGFSVCDEYGRAAFLPEDKMSFIAVDQDTIDSFLGKTTPAEYGKLCILHVIRDDSAQESLDKIGSKLIEI